MVPTPPLFVLLAPPSLSFITSDEPAVSWLINKRRLELEHLLKFSRVLSSRLSRSHIFNLSHESGEECSNTSREESEDDGGKTTAERFNVCAFKQSEV